MIAYPGEAQELRYREEPLSMEEMTQYKDILFRTENFERVTNGMTEEQVISILGPPKDLKKEHRRRSRWTVHYYYPEGHVVNFKNGLVVGKEKN
jgi:uncharacterized membrane protein